MSGARCHLTGQFKPAPLTCSVWFERDRQHISLNRGDVELCALWDEDVSQAIEDGMLTTPRLAGRADESDWLPHIVAYAREVGALPA